MTGQGSSPVAGQGLRRFLQPTAPATGSAGPGAPAVPPHGAVAPGPAAGPAGSPGQAEETCELCAAPIGPVHGHLADLENSTLSCACRACYLLFTEPGAGRGRYRAVPDRYLRDPARPLTAAEWAELDVPVGLAFFLYSSRRGQVCGFYPSPAGVTECTLDLAAWARLGQAHPLLSSPEDDVEAVLVNRADAGVECFLVPVDVCYELAGRMRMLWQGFDGGAEARQSIAEFLDSVRSRARDLAPGP
ncbi:MAG TPA: DUF5947 family protein [Streptosporangiaceae bacterium]|nr:DUF5947 family protein [Streptosporangiaceae bacterium]